MKDYQNILLPYAYNILGSIHDAEDVIQEVILKFTLIDKEIKDVKNYLIKAVINQSINLKNRQKKIQNQESWLPEPYINNLESDIEKAEIMPYAIMLLFENLNTKERAVFILKEAFSYKHQEIANLLDVSIENSRKLFSRAKFKLKKVKSTEYDFNDSIINQKPLLVDFIKALKNKDVQLLHKLISDDISFRADGGKEIKVVTNKCDGLVKVSPLLIKIYHQFHKNFTVRYAILNKELALLYYDGNALRLCQLFSFKQTEGVISGVYNILDPEKIQKVQKILD